MSASDETQGVSPIFLFGAAFMLAAVVIGTRRRRGESWSTAVKLGGLAALTMVPFLSFVFPHARVAVRIASALLIAVLLLFVIVRRRRR